MPAFFRVAVFVLTAIAATAEPDYALGCRGWQWETMTLLNRLPAEAQQEELVARVEVMETVSPYPNILDWWFTHLVKVRVIEAVKGATAGEVFIVNMRGTACDQNATGKSVGQRGYIAGRMEKAESGQVYFTGRWRQDLASGGLVKDAD